MAHAGVKHDYHLVNPSPWPLVGSIAAVVLALGLVVVMKGFVPVPADHIVNGVTVHPSALDNLLFQIFGKTPAANGQPAQPHWALLGIGALGVIYTMIGWWTDVVKEANGGDHTPVVSLGLRYGMILFIASEVMFFVAWFWIFFEMALFHHVRTASPLEDVRTAWATWPPKGVEAVPAFHLPLINTLTLLLSGTTVTWSHHALQQGDRRGATIGLALTIVLGVLFTGIQAYEYNHILSEHLFYGTPEVANSGLYGSAFFMATGFHGFHVIVGSIFLTVCLIRMLNGGFTPKQHFGFEAAAWYWHFVDVVWLFLFTFVYVIFGAGWGH